MPLFIVEDHTGWSRSISAVRAESEAEAVRLATGIVDVSKWESKPAPIDSTWCGSKSISVHRLPEGGDPQVLWMHEESPDSPREDY